MASGTSKITSEMANSLPAWCGRVCLGLVWSGAVWSGLVCSGLVWSAPFWSGLYVFSSGCGVVWSGLAWSGLVCSRLFWSGFVSSGLVLSGLVWPVCSGHARFQNGVVVLVWAWSGQV